MAACAVIVAFTILCGHSQTPSPADTFRGGKVEWARLKTDSRYWDRHAPRDSELLNFIRDNTSLNIDRAWYAATARNLDELCTYPFLFTDGVHSLGSETEVKNLVEYIHRGGFLMIDSCIAPPVNPTPDGFYSAESRALLRMIPGLRITPLPANHEVFSIYFKIKDQPPHTNMDRPDWIAYPMFGLYDGPRMIGVLSMSGLQCGWAHITTNENARTCMEMMTNIYLYAITR
ncbi:MAG: DUF4159 domain-containing protein [Verrucomicrobia bacterium]|nr:DUF4159 domain-containing protein [Verrucomicrobiota bacterium]